MSTKDVRREGSGNIGATNVLRTLGKPFGITVFALDVLKGALPVLVVSWILYDASNPIFNTLCRIAAAVGAILGHNFPAWLRFKGGKGIATSAGVLAALVPVALLIIAVVWLLLTLLTGFVSIGSIGASLALPFACWITRESLALILVTAAMSAVTDVGAPW